MNGERTNRSNTTNATYKQGNYWINIAFEHLKHFTCVLGRVVGVLCTVISSKQSLDKYRNKLQVFKLLKLDKTSHGASHELKRTVLLTRRIKNIRCTIGWTAICRRRFKLNERALALISKINAFCLFIFCTLRRLILHWEIWLVYDLKKV